MAVWKDPLLPKIEIPADLKSQWFQLGSAKYQLLPHQYELLAAKEEEICDMGGYGCLAASARINGIPIPEWTGCSPVASMLGPRTTSRSFLKGRTDLYKVRAAHGQEVEVTLDHRFLTPTGWKRLRDLQVGSLLVAGGILGAESEWGKPTSYRASYSSGFHPCDEQLPSWLAYVLNRFPQRFGLSSGLYLRTDDLPVSLSKNDFLFLSEILDSGAQHQAVLAFVEYILRERRTDVPTQWSSFQTRIAALSLPSEVQREQYDFLACSNYTTIVEIVSTHNGEFWDLTVPDGHHYAAEGLMHHNSAKTFGGVLKVSHSLMIPNNRFIIGRFAATDLEETTQRDLVEFLYKAELLVEAPNSRTKKAIVRCVDPVTQRNLGYTSEASFQHLDDPKHLRGRHIGGYWIDEGSEVHKDAKLNLDGRCRLPAIAGNYQKIITGNPEGRNYLYDHFFNSEILEKVVCGHPQCKLSPEECNANLRRKRRGIHSTSFENYFLAPDYIEGMLAAYSPSQRQRYLDGDFDIFEGAVFSEFNRDLHVLSI